MSKVYFGNFIISLCNAAAAILSASRGEYWWCIAEIAIAIANGFFGARWLIEKIKGK